jgi:hypothetical protein
MDDETPIATPPLQTVEEVRKWLHPVKLEDITEYGPVSPHRAKDKSITHYVKVEDQKAVAVTQGVCLDIEQLLKDK